MTFKWGRPVTLPRMTTDEFKKQRDDYVAKHGYRIHIPGFEDVIKIDITPEPTELEMFHYRRKDVEKLGEKRFEEIRALMQAKRDKFLRLMASPKPDVLMNAASIMTALDNINDALGTLAVIARIIARRLPATASKIVRGPAGWALLAADIANLALELSSLPFKAKRLQHELNDTVKGHPLSKKAKLRRMRKLRRLGLTKGEIIEGLQTTENVCGIGISLGPIMGLLWDIPAGVVRSIRGETVTVTGIPRILEGFDHPWAKLMNTFWTAILSLGAEDDEEISKGLIATQLAAQVAQTYTQDVSPLDAISPLEGLSTPAPVPYFPSTQTIVLDELGAYDSHTGWWPTGAPEMDPRDPIEIHLDQLQIQLAEWRERNKRSATGMVAAQHLVETGPAVLEIMEGEGSMEMDYDPGTMTILQLMNQNFRLPLDITAKQAECFWDMAENHYWMHGHLTQRAALTYAKTICGFDFTQEVPETPVPEEYKKPRRRRGIQRLRIWYMWRTYGALRDMANNYLGGNVHYWRHVRDVRYIPKKNWLLRYGFPYVRYEDWWAVLTPAQRAGLEHAPILWEFFSDPTQIPLWYEGVPMFPGDPPEAMVKWHERWVKRIEEKLAKKTP